MLPNKSVQPRYWKCYLYSCNTGTRALPDMSALALGCRAYTSGNALIPVLQLLHNDQQYNHIKIITSAVNCLGTLLDT